jgi:hypothetical protein
MNHLLDLFGFDSQTVQRLRLGKGFIATHATEAAHNTIFILKFGEVFRFTITAMTVQTCLSRQGKLT